MAAHLEPITFVLRAGKEFSEYGDPYQFSATVQVRGDEAHIMGASGKLTMQIYYDIRIQLKNIGINKVSWERLRDDVKKVKHRI